MSHEFDDWKNRIATLSRRERAELARVLIDSLEDDCDVQAAWDTELSRRVAEIKSGQVVGRPADEVFAELRKKYS